MESAGVPDLSIRTFLHHLQEYQSGSSAMLSRTQIEPIDKAPDADDFQEYRQAGEAALDRVVVIKLNGGLATSMGLSHAKSLLQVRQGHTFLDLIALQVLALRQQAAVQTPLLLMNSFRTDADSLAALSAHPELAIHDLPLSFLQHRVPKIDVATGLPVEWPADPELEWCPPGHGDIYAALASSKLLNQLLTAGYEVAFISNADNLGAVIEPSLLGYLLQHQHGLMMEVADRTAADRKGGHLCRRVENGRLALRETAQCPTEEVEEFQDIDRYRYFNTNNIWIHLPTLDRLLNQSGGVIKLPTIINEKTVDPRDPASATVAQLETAMGSAISLFPNATAVRVGRHRFSPVKATNDLLGVRSDAYQLTADGRISLHPSRQKPPTIELDSRYYKLIDDFEARFPDGPPGLLHCQRLSVEGDIVFGQGVKINGITRISSNGQAVRVPDGAILEGHVDNLVTRQQ
jgi:UTP--glucose-1-phosphate uridylyltransferase